MYQKDASNPLSHSMACIFFIMNPLKKLLKPRYNWHSIGEKNILKPTKILFWLWYHSWLSFMSILYLHNVLDSGLMQIEKAVYMMKIYQSSR